jgi:putative ABC transport system permease protein
MRRSLMLEDLAQDVRISLRGALRAPITAMVIVATVGLGIGATTTVFTAVNAALLRPLPYADPDRLVRIYTDVPPNRFPFSVVDYLALNAEQTRFELIAGYAGRAMTFTDGTVAERVRGRDVSPEYFTLLGIRPALGRALSDVDGRPASPRTAVVSHEFWQRRLGGRPDAIGKPVRFDGVDYTLVGVLPKTVGPLEQGQDAFIAARWQTPARKGPFFITMLARLRVGTDRSGAAAELRAINRRLFPSWRASYQDERATWSMMDLKAHVVGDVRTTAGLALAAVGLVWLVACANASNLLVARAASRRRELAVRAALGASRARVVRHLLTESGLLACGAASLGIAIAWTGIDLLRSFGDAYFPRTQEILFDSTAIWLLAVLTTSSALLFGLVPAVHAAAAPLDESLRAEGRTSTGSAGGRRLRRALVAAQFAIATPLLVVAALLLVSLNQLGRVDLGFDTRHIVTGTILLSSTQYSENGRIAAFWDDLQRRISSVPGVVGVAFADGRPPNDVNNFNNFDLEDAPTPPGQSQPITPWVAVSPDYFRVLGLPLLEGRLLDERDAQAADLLAIVVDRAWAKRFFPNGSAVGRRIRQGGCTTCPRTTVVGVVSEVKYAGLDKPDQGTVYQPLAPQRLFRNVIVRASLDPAALVTPVRQALRSIDPDLPLSGVATMDGLVARSLERPRSLSLLIGSLAIVALALSMIGIYGVMAHYVHQHAKEIGIRLALGGSRHDVLRLVVGQGMKVVTSGVGIGALAALMLTRLTATLLFGVRANDPVTLVAVAGAMLIVALLACLVPAARATGLQPADVLRND